jgi:hypothetical protein
MRLCIRLYRDGTFFDPNTPTCQSAVIASNAAFGVISKQRFDSLQRCSICLRPEDTYSIDHRLLLYRELRQRVATKKRASINPPAGRKEKQPSRNPDW